MIKRWLGELYDYLRLLGKPQSRYAKQTKSPNPIDHKTSNIGKSVTNWNSIIGFFHRSIQFACFSGIYYCCSLVVVDYVIISGHCTAAVPIKHTREQRNENHFTVPNDPAEMTRTLYHTTMFWRRFCRSILRCQELKIILYFFPYVELFLLCFWHGKLCFCICLVGIRNHDFDLFWPTPLIIRRHLGPLHVFWQVSFGFWVMWSISS